MVSFESDYNNGTHEKILEALIRTNGEALSGYGNDPYCERAKEKIRLACHCPDAQVQFLTGGTQTNSTIIDAMLNNYEGVIAVTTGHISVHEAGATEHSGHKVLTIPGHGGKICVEELKQWLRSFYADETCEHMVQPGMVYISHPTEYGTLYSKQELEDISAVCRAYELTLFLDGARLGYGLAGEGADVTLEDLAKLCDVFYIGGTKVGALCGEAVVFTKQNMPKHFLTTVKQNGALMAKGRVLGIQFDTLFTDDLYLEISRHAIRMAEKMKKLFAGHGYQFLLESPTNQQFIILENDVMNRLKEKLVFSFWEHIDEDHTAVRFATSWSTTDEDLEMLARALDEI